MSPMSMPRLIPERPAAGLLVAAVVSVAFGWIAATHASGVAGGADSAGYLSAARGIRTGQHAIRIRALDQFELDDFRAPIFTPIGFSPGTAGTHAPLYPPGFPMHVAALGAIIGHDAASRLVAPLAGAAGLLAFFIVARLLGLTAVYASAGTLILAACPTYLYQSVQPMSDIVATAWTLVGFGAALGARRHHAWAVLAGAAFGLTVATRPTGALLLPGLLAALPHARGAYGLLCLGAVPLAIVNGWYNDAAYGGVFVQGYAGLGGDVEFALGFMPTRVAYYLLWLSVLMTPLVTAAGLGAMLAPGVRRRDRLLLSLWFAPTFLFYCAYRYYDAWWYTRFLLPVVPAVILGALLATRALRERLTGWLERQGRSRNADVLLAGALVIVVGVGVSHTGRFGVLDLHDGERVYREAALGTLVRVPPRSIIVSMQTSGALAYYTGFMVARWDVLEPERFEWMSARWRADGYAVYALLFPFEVDGFTRRVGADWDEITTFRQVALLELRP